MDNECLLSFHSRLFLNKTFCEIDARLDLIGDVGSHSFDSAIDRSRKRSPGSALYIREETLNVIETFCLYSDYGHYGASVVVVDEDVEELVDVLVVVHSIVPDGHPAANFRLSTSIYDPFGALPPLHNISMVVRLLA